MKTRLFRRFCEIAHQQAGIALGDGKEALVEARINKRMRQLGVPTPEAYLDRLLSDASGEELTSFLDAISTNVTSFFRETEHFTALQSLVNKRIVAGRTELKLWSAASSSGEEPYSMAISALEVIGDRPIELRILATDISTRVLSAARTGQYSSVRMKGLSPERRERFFRKMTVDGQSVYEVCPSVRRCITFGRLNLSRPPFPMKGPFDAVFCRNVMIYFDIETRKALLREIHRLLPSDGLLFVGHSESLAGCDLPFTPVGSATYVPRDPSLPRTSRSPVFPTMAEVI